MSTVPSFNIQQYVFQKNPITFAFLYSYIVSNKGIIQLACVHVFRALFLCCQADTNFVCSSIAVGTLSYYYILLAAMQYIYLVYPYFLSMARTQQYTRDFTDYFVNERQAQLSKKGKSCWVELIRVVEEVLTFYVPYKLGACVSTTYSYSYSLVNQGRFDVSSKINPELRMLSK